MGELLRSKGFVWIATTNNVMGGWQPEVSEFVSKRMKNEANGEAWEYGDRRQELVFIGQGLKHDYIQRTLDRCLLNDEEMLLGPERWRESMGDSDRIRLTLLGERIKWTIEELDEED